MKTVKSKIAFPFIKEILDKGSRVRITVTGMSMYPFLREHMDSVELSKANFSERDRGDIVMVMRNSHEYVMHRVMDDQANLLL